MNLTFILYNEKTKSIEREVSDEGYKVKQMFEAVTELYEKSKIFLFQEIKHDNNTIIREFVTEQDGLVCSLIVCAGRATNIIKTK